MCSVLFLAIMSVRADARIWLSEQLAGMNALFKELVNGDYAYTGAGSAMGEVPFSAVQGTCDLRSIFRFSASAGNSALSRVVKVSGTAARYRLAVGAAWI